MKFHIISISGLMASLTVTSVLAIDPPPDNAEPPTTILGQADTKTPATEEAPRQSLPFIGLSTAPIPKMLCEHLNLPEDSGVIIRTVCPDSPAANAGLSVNDIITEAGGEPVASPESLSALMREKKIGEQLDLHLIHRGKSSNVTVTLIERPADLAMNDLFQTLPEGLSKAHAERLRERIEQNQRSFESDPGFAFPDARLQGQIRQMRERMNRAMSGDIPPITQNSDGSVRFQQNSTVRMMDSEGSVEIRSADGSTEITIRDKKNDIVWSGPWDTENDKAAAPAAIRERINQVDSGNGGKGFTLRFGKLGDETPEINEN